MLPSQNDQQEIADALRVLDSKIELLIRQNQTLEAMARAIFKSWFVDFDPVRAKAEGRTPEGMDAATAALFPSTFTDAPLGSPLGPIPEGWGVATLGELADLNWGDTKTTKAAYTETGFTAYSASGPDGFMDRHDFEGKGVVLSAIGANCGQTWLADGKWSCIKNTIWFMSKCEAAPTVYLYLATKGSDFWPKRGSAQPFISQTDARSMRVVVPSKEIAAIFQSFANSIYERVRANEQTSSLLADLRDTLLPRLISGKLRLTDAQALTEDAA